MVGITDDFSTYAVSKLPTFREDFSDYINQTLADTAWVTTDTAMLRVNITNEVADFAPTPSIVHDEQMAFDLITPVSDEFWTLRCVVDHTNITIGADATSNDLYIGLADNSSDSWDINQNFIGCALRISNGLSPREWRVSQSVGDAGASKPNSGGLTQNFGGDVFTSDVDGIEIKRISVDIMRVTRYNQDFSTVIGSVDLDMTSFGKLPPVDLQFIKIGTFNSDGTGDSTNEGTIDNIEIWGEEPTPDFSDEFTEDNWLDTGAGWGVNTGNETLDCTFQHNGSDNHTSFDLQTILGETVDDEKWVLRFKVNIISLSKGTSTVVSFGITDTEAGGGLGATQDSVTGCIDVQNSVNEGYGMGNTSGDNASLPIQAFPASKIDATIATATDYFVELKRLSATEASMRVFTDETYTTPLAGLSQRTILSTSGQNIRYIKFFEREASFAGDITYEVDDMEFWNGISDVTSIGAQQGDVTFKDNFLLKTARFTDDFSVDNWTTSNATFINVAGGINSFDLPVTTTVNAGSIIDLGAGNVSDTSWVLRTKLDISTFVTNTDLTAQEIHVGISESDQTVFSNIAQDYIGLKIQSAGSANSYNVVGADGVAPTTGGAIVDTFTRVPSVETIFIEIIRSNATELTVNQYSDSTYTTLLESAGGTIVSTITGLRYIKIMAKNADGTGDGDITGSIDDLEFYNGVSTLTNWVPAGEIFVDTTNQVILADVALDDTNDAISHDLQSSIGGNASDINWEMRFKLDLKTVTQGADATNIRLFMGVSSLPSSSNSEASHDFLGLEINVGSTLNEYRIFNVDGTALASGTSANFTKSPAVEVVYVSLSRTSETLFKIRLFSDKNYTELLEEQTIATASTVNTLRHIWIGNLDQAPMGVDSVLDVEIDDVCFFNGVSVSQTPVFESIEFEDNFASYADQTEADAVWARTDTTIIADFSANEIDASFLIDSTNDSIAHDLGADGVSDTAWTLRFKWDLQTADDGGNTSTKFAMFGIGDNSQATGGSVGGQFGLFIRFDLATDTSGIIFRFANNANMRTGTLPGVSFTHQTQVEIFYIEIRRISDDTAVCSLFSDPDYTQLIESVKIVDSNLIGVTDLRFIKFYNDDSVSDTGEIAGKIKDVQFWNGESAKEHQNIWRVD